MAMATTSRMHSSRSGRPTPPGATGTRGDDRSDLAWTTDSPDSAGPETDFATGDYWFETVKPGPVPDPEGEYQAPHINVIVQARGMLNPSFTRIYFSGRTPRPTQPTWC